MSKIDICNAALSLIGSDAIVSSIDPPDGSVEAGHCKRFYAMALAELLDWRPWSFAKKRVQLAQVALNQSAVWAYAYALPADCLVPVRVLQQSALNYPPSDVSFNANADDIAVFTERGSADYQVETGVLYTHEPQAVLLYTANISDTASFSPLFTTALAHLLAAYIAGPLIKGGEGARTNGTFRSAVFGRTGAPGLADRAAANDANVSSERAGHIPDHIKVRA